MRRALTILALAGAVALGVFLERQVGSSSLAEHEPPSFPMAAKVMPPPAGEVYWGAFRQGAPYVHDLVTGLESQVGRQPAILMWYQEWEGRPSFPAADAAFLYRQGIVPMISWEPWKPPAVFGRLKVNQPEYRLSNIASGAFDPYIRRYAEEIKRYGGPVMLRPFHEMDGFWYPWGGTVNGNTPSAFVAAWRHVHDIFDSVGASNVTWVWSVNRVSQPRTPGNRVQHYWPGHRYVDWIGISAFNWGTGSPYAVWQGFDGVFGHRYEELLSYGKPIILTETGAPEAGGNKAAWIHDAFTAVLARYPRLGGVVWYDKRDNAIQDWRIDSTPQALSAFRRAVALPGILSADRALATATQAA
jgi:hypothetical protein